MNTSTIHHDFNGYGAYPLFEGEHLIRERLLRCMGGLREKNEICLAKAREEGREKLLSEIMSVKKRMERIASDMEKVLSGVRYKFDRISASDEAAASDLDTRLEILIAECGGVIEAITCSETDPHIIERYTQIMAHLGGVEKLFHERTKIFKRMQVYG